MLFHFLLLLKRRYWHNHLVSPRTYHIYCYCCESNADHNYVLHFQDIKRQLRHSTPDIEQGSAVTSQTIFGAPCNVIYSHRELRQNFLGCQNVPTAVWMTKFKATFSGSSAYLPSQSDSARSRWNGWILLRSALLCIVCI